MTITVTADDENGDAPAFIWSVTSGHSGITPLPNTQQVSFPLPDYLIRSDTIIQQTLELSVRVSDTADEVSTMVSVVVNKDDNGQAEVGRLSRGTGDGKRMLTLPNLDFLADDPDGGGITSSVVYQWQLCVNGTDCEVLASWDGILNTNSPSYTTPNTRIPATQNRMSGYTIRDGDQFRISVTYTDRQGYTKTIYSGRQSVTPSAEVRIRSKVFLEGPLQ